MSLLFNLIFHLHFLLLLITLPIRPAPCSSPVDLIFLPPSSCSFSLSLFWPISCGVSFFVFFSHMGMWLTSQAEGGFTILLISQNRPVWDSCHHIPPAGCLFSFSMNVCVCLPVVHIVSPQCVTKKFRCLSLYLMFRGPVHFFSSCVCAFGYHVNLLYTLCMGVWTCLPVCCNMLPPATHSWPPDQQDSR